MRTLALVLLVGCGSSHQAPGDAGVDAPFDRCASLPYDAIRYQYIAPATMLTWNQAYAACAALGMELASVDDMAEYDHDAALQTPYWIGTNVSDEGLETLDGCEPPYLNYAPGEPATMDLNTCFYRGADGMHEVTCDQTSAVIGALCETPRLNESCGTMGSTYSSGDSHTKADATTSCTATGGHVVELNSPKELQTVLDKFANQSEFWVAATFNGTVFLSVTGCPEVFGWAAGEPMAATGMCVAYKRGVGMQIRNCADSVGTICETN